MTLLPEGIRLYRLDNLVSQGATPGGTVPFEFGGRRYFPGLNSHWKTTSEGMKALTVANRIQASTSQIQYVRFFDDFSVQPVSNLWTDTTQAGFVEPKLYVVQTLAKVVQRCVLMATDPGDLVFDPTCGSGTTSYVAEQWGRRWITCDTSRVAITLAKQRLMSALYDYYELAHPDEGVGSGLKYKTVPHVTLKSVANNPEIREGMTREQIDAAIAKYAEQETLYDQPFVDSSKARVTGPFTVEAVPAPTVQALDELSGVGAAEEGKADPSPPSPTKTVGAGFGMTEARSGPTLRDAEWRDELLKTGIRGKGGQTIDFSRVEPLGGTRWLHADAETKGVKAERVVISFGPEHAPLEKRQVEAAWQEAHELMPRPAMIVFAAFQFDPEAAREIDGLTKEKTGMTFLTAQMNPDLLTEDLKKKRSSNQSFWLIGRPDVEVRKATKAVTEKQIPHPRPREDRGRVRNDSGLYVVEVRGFDYFNTRTGTIESGDTSKIAMWLLDTDYDGRSLYPRQVFFPLADEDGGWARLAKSLKAEIDPELIEAYRGTVSLPFEAGEHKRIGVKVIDDRGIESLKVMELA